MYNLYSVFHDTIYNGDLFRKPSLPIKAVRAELCLTTFESQNVYFSLQLDILIHFCGAPPLFQTLDDQHRVTKTKETVPLSNSSLIGM